MRGRRVTSLSPPVLCLLIAGAGACALNWGRERWASAWWYPEAVGLVATGAIIAIVVIFGRFLSEGAFSNYRRAAFFAISSALSMAGAAVMCAECEWAMALLGVSMSVSFAWGALGVIYQWPGFRAPATDVDDSPDEFGDLDEPDDDRGRDSSG